MSAATFQNLVLSLLGIAAFLHLMRLRPRTDIHAAVLCLLGSLTLIFASHAAIDAARSDWLARTALYVGYVGVCVMTPSWLWFAARFTRSEFAERRPGLPLAAAIPPTVALLALVTNDGHRLFAASLDHELLRQGPHAWAGPVFWASLSWQLLVALVGVAMFAGYAMRLAPRQRRHAYGIAVSAALPTFATIAHHLELLPFEADPIPLTSGLGVGGIVWIAIRYRLADVLPIARREVIDELPDAVVLADVDGNLLDLNPAATRLLLLTAKAARLGPPLARTLSRLAADEQRADVENALVEALACGAPVGMPLRTRGEREIEIQIDTVYRDGNPSGRYALIRDVTETRRYERMLRESQQRVIVGGLAAGLAHEVNNPLAFVASNLQQIHRIATFDPCELEPLEKRRAEELAELSEVVAETIEGVARITEIVGRIIRPGTVSEDDFVRLDIGRVIQDAVRLIELHGQYAKALRVLPVGDDLPPVEGSPERLSQALLNLLLNAQQACQSLPDSVVTIEARAEAGGVAVEIGVCSDSGSSWSGQLPEIAPSGSAAEAELSAAYEIVREHGGSLEAASARTSFFVVRLPAA
jgi:PAS domain S-box-containing protein